MDFSANPVRFDRSTETIYTNPPVKNTYWVQIIGSNEVSLVATGVFTPEELPYVEVGLMPGLPHLWDEKSYNSKETQIYQYTGGVFVPQGVFSFDYKKTTYDEVKDFVDELRAEAQKDKQLEEAAQNLSEAWKETLRAEQELSVIKDVFNGIGTITDSYFGDYAIEPASAKNDADAYAHSSEVQSEIDRANESLDDMESSEGSLRKLEDFSMDGGGDGDQQQAQKAMGEMLHLLKKTIVSTREILECLQTEKNALASMVASDKPQEDIIQQTQTVRDAVAEFSRFGSGFDRMSGDFAHALLGYVHAEQKTKTEYAVLAELCDTWKSTLDQTLSGTAPVVDIQSGILIPDTYPVHIVPLLKSFVAAMYQQDADGTIMLTLKTDTTPTLVMDYYRLALNDADNISEVSMAGMLIFSAEKDEYEISIMAGANQMGGPEPTMVQITLVPMT
jgi:hypothetical protein